MPSLSKLLVSTRAALPRPYRPTFHPLRRTLRGPSLSGRTLHAPSFVARMASTSASPSGGKPSDSLPLRNRLNESRSPYVRGHANNPVAWQMWNDETIQLAKKHNRLIFLSIGYAACHWCHVMERESFENDEVADILNESFIPVKVDREERPDVDRIYMNYVQATTGSGGWPLNVFLTPHLEPIFGGTYWPGPNAPMMSRMRGQAGFVDILQKLRQVWREQPDRCRRSAKDILSQLKRFTEEGGNRRGSAGEEGDGLELHLLAEAYRHFAKRFDKVNGGFGAAPKFPTPVNLTFLARLSSSPSEIIDAIGKTECQNATAMVTTTLQRMARGGIHDHIGHGYARYSVTADWSLPHFEKMLYDQAQLLDVYLDAYLLSRDPEMLNCVNDIADYLTLDALAAPQGGFHSAEDADSYYRRGDTEKREGAFYVWTRQEFDEILGKETAEVCARYWNVKRHGNVSPQHDAHNELTNQNVLAVVRTPKELAKEFNRTENEILQTIKEGRKKLWDHRERERPRPNLDDKIVTSWNGLAIGSLARASTVLEKIDSERAQRYRDQAIKAVKFIHEHLFDENSGKLNRVYREGPGDVWGFADDYAFMIRGLLDLYEATFDEFYLEFADRLQQTQLSLFWDPTSQGFFSTEASAPNLILRLKDGMDNAEPSANGISAQNLYRLSSMLEDETYATRARETCIAFESEMGDHPFLFTSMLPAVVAGELGVKSVVLAGRDSPEIDRAVETLRNRTPGEALMTMVRCCAEGDGDGEGDGEGKGGSRWLRQRNPIVRELHGDKPRVMVCENGACREDEGLLRNGG